MAGPSTGQMCSSKYCALSDVASRGRKYRGAGVGTSGGGVPDEGFKFNGSAKTGEIKSLLKMSLLTAFALTSFPEIVPPVTRTENPDTKGLW